jgi:hypothetical protein
MRVKSTGLWGEWGLIQTFLRSALQSRGAEFLRFVVRPDGAFHQWREVPPRELSIALVADERFGRATDWIEAS